MRDNSWLQSHLQNLISAYFPDMQITNPIEIRWGREAKFRFGSIKLEGRKSVKSFRGLKGLLTQASSSGKLPQKSLIIITSMFKSEEVPADVVSYTVCHELSHYAHGFSSANKRMFRHPHHGGIVNAELEKRGAGHLVKAYKSWLKEYRGRVLAGRTRN